jgi:predicted PurR-regulated permease PerM
MIIAWALLLAFFVWSIRPVLSPIVLFLVLVYLLTPLFGTEAYRRLVIALGTLTALWLVHVAGSFLAPFVLGLILAYVADPLVDRLERQNVSRMWGAVIVVGLAGLVVGLSLVLVIPMVFEQGRQFLEDLPEMLAGLQRWYEAQIQAFADSPLPLIRDIQFERALEIESRDVMAFISEQIRSLQPSWGAAIGLGRGVQTAFTILGYIVLTPVLTFYLLRDSILGYIVLTPVLTFYLLRDFHSIERWVGRLVPRDHRKRILSFLETYDELLGEYLRGQLLVALFVGLATGIGFWIVGFPNAVLLGVIAGVFNIVPYLGLVVSLIPALFIALVTVPIWISLLKVAGVFLVVQAFDGYFLSPKIVGDRVGLHPVWVMLAIIAFGSFFGLTGLLLAIPLAVLIKLLIENTFAAYQKSVYYRQADAVHDEDVA